MSAAFDKTRAYVLSVLPTSCCGRTPPDISMKTTGQLLHTFCACCGSYFYTFVSFELVVPFGDLPLTLDDVTLPAREWAKVRQIDVTTIEGRLARGYSVHEALTPNANLHVGHSRVG